MNIMNIFAYFAARFNLFEKDVPDFVADDFNR